jgi:hypothetical protein
MGKKDKNGMGDQPGGGRETQYMPAVGPQVGPAAARTAPGREVTRETHDDEPDYIDGLVERYGDQEPEAQISSDEELDDDDLDTDLPPDVEDAEGREAAEGEESQESALAEGHEPSPEDGKTAHRVDDAVLNETVDVVIKAHRSGEDDRIAAGYRIKGVFFGNDPDLMTSRNPRKVASFAMLVSHPRNTVEESTLRGWVYAAVVHEDLGNTNISVDPPLSVSLLNLLYRLKDPEVWRRIAPEMAGMTVSKAKEYIKARTGKKTEESTSDMILKQLRNPLRAMANEDLVSLITDPDLLAGRLTPGEMHTLLGEFDKIRKPVEDFLAMVATFQSILSELTRTRAA